MGKVTDPTLLAQLDQSPAPVSDPALLAQLEGPPQSAGAAFVDHLGNQGMLGFSDEAIGGWKAIAKKLLPKSLGGADPGVPLVDLYRGERDQVRSMLDADSKEHPIASKAGDISGALLPALATMGGSSGASGAGIGVRLLRAAGSGAGWGGASGFGNSAADDGVGLLKDTAKGAGVGAGVGVGATLLGALARSASPWLRERALNVGRRFLSGTQSSLSKSKPLADEAVEEAFAQGAIAPLKSIHGAAELLSERREAVGDVYGRIVKALEDNGVAGPEADALAQKYATQGRNVASSNTNGAVRGVYDNEANALTAKEPSGDFTVARDPAGRLGLRQTETIKQSLQDRARSAYAQQDPREVGEALKDAASIARQANEDAIAQQAAASSDPVLQTVAEGFVPVKQKLSRLIRAGDAATAAAQRAQRNHAIGLKEASLAAGDPGKLLLAYLAKSRGTSTLASALHGSAEAIDNPTSAADLLRRLLIRETQQQTAANQ